MSAHSDHFLVKVKLDIKLPTNWNQKRKILHKIVISKLKEDQIANEYKKIREQDEKQKMKPIISTLEKIEKNDKKGYRRKNRYGK